MLTLSERWLTTQTSWLFRAATATGSRPTGMELVWMSARFWTRKTSRRLSGVLTANRRGLAGDSASGRTCPLSKRVNEDAAFGKLRSPAFVSADASDRRLAPGTDM